MGFRNPITTLEAATSLDTGGGGQRVVVTRTEGSNGGGAVELYPASGPPALLEAGTDEQGPFTQLTSPETLAGLRSFLALRSEGDLGAYLFSAGAIVLSPDTYVASTRPIDATTPGHALVRRDYVDRAPAARLDGTGSQAVGSASNSQVLLGLPAYARGMTTGSGRITCTRAGLYLVAGSITFTGNMLGRRLAGIGRNGAMVPQSQSSVFPNAATTAYVATVTVQVVLAVDDYVSLIGYQDSGSTLNFARDSCTLSALWVGETP